MSNTIVNLFGDRGEKRPERRVIDLAYEPDFTLGDLLVQPSLREVSGPGGKATVEPKVMQVLVALSRSPGTIYSRDDLIDTCWDGRIVGDASINRVLSLLRSALRSVGAAATSIETVPRVGYRVLTKDGDVAPRDDNEPDDEPVDEKSDVQAKDASSRPRSLLLLALVALLAVAGAGWWFFASPSSPERVTIAMLPIVASSSDDSLLAKGLEAELRDELGRSTGVSVTVSNTATSLAEAETEPSAIGKVLGADYVLSGRLVRADSSIALESRLLDVENGSVLWEKQIASTEGESEHIPARASRAILTALGRPADETRSLAAVSPDDFALYLTARGMIRTRDLQQMLAALDILRPLSDRNPEFPGAYSAIAKALFLTASDQAGDIDATRTEAEAMARQAYALDPHSSDALKTLGLLSLDIQERVRLLDKATTMDPGDGEAWLWLSHASANPMFPGQEATALRRLAAIDPLWGLSWQVPFNVASQSGIAQATEIEGIIRAAAQERWQVDASLAREAILKGEVADGRQKLLEAMAAMTPDQRQISGMQLYNAELMLGIEPVQAQQTGPQGVVQSALLGRPMPSMAELESYGLAGRNFWRITPLVIAGPLQLLREGRAGDVVALYDNSFATQDEFEEFSMQGLRPHHQLANIATYVGYAMAREGRSEDAAALFALAEKSVAQWRTNDFMHMTPFLFEANLAAAQGQDARAIHAVEQMIAYHWPYAVQSPGAMWTGPLLDDPLWADLQKDSRLVKVLAPIRSRLDAERTKALSGTRKPGPES